MAEMTAGTTGDRDRVSAEPGAAGSKGLRQGALGLVSSIVIGTASVAPAYSLAATLGFVVAAVGLQSPVVMILAFVPMFLIAFGYQGLNEADPDCGTTFTWGARTFGPRTGWLGGWAIIAADIIVMANLAQIAGGYGFQLVGANGLAASPGWTEVAGIVWIVVMTVICYIGIEVSVWLQRVLLTVELLMLLVLSVVALAKVYSGSAPAGSIHVAASWFNPFDIGSFSALTSGLLLAVFIYWGWDTAVSINEETKDSAKTPGRAAVLSTILLLVTYALVTVAAQAFAGVDDKGSGLANPDNSGDVLSGLGTSVFGSAGFGWFLSKLLVFMVLTSASASTQTTIMPTARTSLSMATHKAIPARFGRVHPRFQTPTWSTIGMGLASVAFYAALTKISNNVLGDSILSLGLAIAFYYGLTGLACFWYYLPLVRRGRRYGKTLWLRCVLPLLGALILFAFFGYACHVFWASDYGSTYWTLPFSPHWAIGGVFLTGIGALVLGIPLMLIYRFVRPGFFRGETIPKSNALTTPLPAGNPDGPADQLAG
ncbi:APC family permease [Actinocrinis sp.]|uniref:APC family permease n=1 Tax=Actinocrinis sp. TaxID=1920516 RepID=UPI002C3327B5|nr:APC family permease [Actinocrinis sp.]HXR71318.1 APC family permease [Actinocrinis sp.]